MTVIMKLQHQCLKLAVMLVALTKIFGQELNRFNYIGQNNAVSNETLSAYSLGVRMGIINTEKYPLESFERDERNIFKDLYKEWQLAESLNGSRLNDYQEWLVMNNFGILSDTQESLYKTKITRRRRADNKKVFTKKVQKGDILIASRGVGGLMGHAAIMTSDYWVLEMSGGRGWANGIPDNNRQIAKDDWYEENSSDWVTVYRCPDNDIARKAAIWADHEYYNPNGGSKKTRHITYWLTEEIWNTNPSYCAKLVMQAYHFGTGKKKVTKNLAKINGIIAPTAIPSYFCKKYELVNKGKF